MYIQAFKTYLRSLPLLAAAALLMEGAALWLGTSSGIGAAVIVHILIAMMFHRAILLNESYSIWGTPIASEESARKQPFMPFTGRVLLFFLPLAAVFVAVIGALAPLTEHENQTAVRTILALGITALVFPFWGALAGTMLPAAAIGADSSFRTACKRGRQTYWPTVGRLFAGPVFFPALLLALILAAASQLPILAIDNPSVWMTFLISTLAIIIGFFTPLLTATALSMAYRTAETKA